MNIVAIRQGALPHGPTQLGDGRRTVAQAGCLFVAIVMVVRATTPNKTLTVAGAQLALAAAHAKGKPPMWFGSALNTPEAVKVLGLHLVERASFDLKVVAADVAAGHPPILGLDFVAGRSSGFSDADHFVVAADVAGDLVKFADPAYGAVRSMSAARGVYRNRPATFAEMLRLAPLSQ